MQERLLSSISDCIMELTRLETQLSENSVSFARCFEGDINDQYQRQNRAALERCNQLKRKLYQLQAEKQAKLLAQAQSNI